MKLLILLIGDNNISNYTLVKFLKRMDFDFDTIGVVYTEKTKNNVEYLKKLLNYQFIKIDVEDVKEDYLKVKEVVKSKLEGLNIEKIFLDYTGGLKSMSLGAFLAVNELEIEENNKYISYVLYQSNEVIFKRGDRYKMNENLTIKDIAGVHGIFNIEYKKENSEFFNLESVFYLLDKVKNNEKEFFEDIWDKDFKILKTLDWKSTLNNYPYNLGEISNKKLKKFQKYIQSEFLEEYIFYILNEMKEELGIYEIAWNVREKEGKNDKVEMDVIATKNNRLYLFSCTTDKSKSTAKQKGFEAKDRATKYGGRNAKAILVSCADENKKKALLDDLKDEKGGATAEVIVFQDLEEKETLKKVLKRVFNAR